MGRLSRRIPGFHTDEQMSDFVATLRRFLHEGEDVEISGSVAVPPPTIFPDGTERENEAVTVLSAEWERWPWLEIEINENELISIKTKPLTQSDLREATDFTVMLMELNDPKINVEGNYA